MTVTLKNVDLGILQVLNSLKSLKSNLEIIQEPSILNYSDSKEDLEKIVEKYENSNAKTHSLDEVRKNTDDLLQEQKNKRILYL